VEIAAAEDEVVFGMGGGVAGTPIGLGVPLKRAVDELFACQNPFGGMAVETKSGAVRLSVS